MAETPGAVPVLLRTEHSAPLGVYPVRVLAEYASRLGYRAIGIAESESLAGLIDLHDTAVRLKFEPLYAMEVSGAGGNRFPLILLATDASGFRQLLELHGQLGSHAYRTGGLAALAGQKLLSGAGLAGFFEAPRPASGPDGSDPVKDWHEHARAVFQVLPRAHFYLRLPFPPAFEKDGANLRFWMDLAARTGLTPIILPVAAFADAMDAPLYPLGYRVRHELEPEEAYGETALFPVPSEEFFRTFLLRPREALENAAAAAPAALENTRKLTERIAWRWEPEGLHPPVVQVGRGFNPETRLWDRIHEAAVQRWPTRIAATKERLYEEFSGLRRQGCMGEFLALCELMERLSHPGLVSVPDRVTGGLLCAHLVGLNPFNPMEQQLPFDEGELRHLRSPLPLHVPDGWQEEIIRILADLFGENSVGIIERSSLPSAPGMKHLVVRHRLERHSYAVDYLRRCGAAPGGKPRWAVALSRQIDRELPCHPSPESQAGVHRLKVPVESVLGLPCLVFELIPDINKTRLWKLRGEGPGEDPTLKPPGEKLLETTREILPLLYSRSHRWAVWLAFQAMEARNWTDLAAALTLVELERHDRAGFLRAIRAKRKSRQSGGKGPEKHFSGERGRKELTEILAMGKGLFLYRDQLQPLLEKVLGIPTRESYTLARRILGSGGDLPPSEKIVKEVVPHLNNPELSYPATQFLSIIPRHLCWRQQIADWTRNLAQFAVLAEQRPLEFARVILDEADRPGEELPSVREFLEVRGQMLLPPCINRSGTETRVEEGGLRLGLSMVENIGPVTGAHLIERRAGRPFQSLPDLLARTSRRLVNRRVIRQLIHSGALDALAGAGSPEALRGRALEAAEDLEGERFVESGNGLQTFLFDLAPPVEEALAPREEPVPRKPLEWLEREIDLYGAVLSMPFPQAVRDLFPAGAPVHLPSRRHWWLGQRLLQAGILRDVWPWYESGERGGYTLAGLDSGGPCVLTVADSKLRPRLAALAGTGDELASPPAILALVQPGGRSRSVERFSFGLLPKQETPPLFHRTPHFQLIDFEPLGEAVEASLHPSFLEITLEQIQKRLVEEIRSRIAPFKIAARSSLGGARVRFQCPNVEAPPSLLEPLERIPLLACQLLIRQLESVEGIRSVRQTFEDRSHPLLPLPEDS